ncbi:hypothetical protein BJX63DRAFT_393972 [Aspergillus granulosus]|uniref:WSC domain-containing protein n=1 Tax=Aspergillus granulosus TaxID=176169 RepID=A0ABR4HDF2_9EURO
MRTIFLSLAASASLYVAAADQTPGLYADPDTISSCVEWYDNNEGLACEETREYWGITPEQFTEWNPSVSLDCEPWEYKSYCIVTQERLDNSSSSATSSTATSTLTSTATLGPSPTAWTDLGCYFDDPDLLPLMEERVSGEGGDGSLTIAKCQNECYRAAYTFAGVKAGNECWCSPFVGGEHARNQTDCNIPCSGANDEICGGKDTVNVFEPVEDAGDEDGPVTSSTTSTDVTTTPTPTGAGDDEESGVGDSPVQSKASKNFALFQLSPRWSQKLVHYRHQK